MEPILIVGLGNPGDKYHHTRHNAGFLALDDLARALNLSWKERKEFLGEVAEGMSGEKKILLLKPLTFMNLSGQSVKALVDYFHIEAKNIIVVSDDVNLPLGTLRTREEGGAGGHNGLTSVIEHLGTPQFPRVRIGVNPPPEHVPLEAWVVSAFTKDELAALASVIKDAVSIVREAITTGALTGTTKNLGEA